MTRWKFAVSLLLVVIVVVAFAGAAWACPMCKDSIATTKNDLEQTAGGSVASAFNTSIYTLILGFFGALSLVSFHLVRGIRGK
jgi:hypothetical protein